MAAGRTQPVCAASVLREGEPSSALTRAADEYLGYLAIERGSSGNTVESYGRDLRRYLAFLADRGIVLPEDVTREVIEEHVRALDEVGLAPASIERAISAIKGFHRFMVTEQICETHPTADLMLPKKPERLPDVISREQVFRLLDEHLFEWHGDASQRPRPSSRRSTAAGCASRSSVTSTSVTCTWTRRCCACLARAPRSAWCPCLAGPSACSRRTSARQGPCWPTAVRARPRSSSMRVVAA